MSSTEFNVNLRDLQFVLFEQLKVDDLCKMKAFADFSVDDFRMIVDEAARFAREAVAPANRPGDEIGCRFEKGDVKVPDPVKKAWHAYREAGWICMNGHAAHGGQGLPTTISISVGELFTGACCSMSLFALLTQGVIHILERFAPEETQAMYLPKLFAGDWTGTMVLTEGGAGTDVGAAKTKARKAGDGDHYLISGEKIFITAGDHDMAENVVHLVLARVEGAQPGSKGLSLFLVPKFRLNADGTPGDFNDVRCVGIEHKLGIHASPTCTMSFGDDGDCRGQILGREGDGIRIMFHMMNEARIDCGVQGLALGSAAYLNALSYAQERVQGAELSQARNPDAPRATIDKHPDVRRMLLWMKAHVEAMRSLLVSTANLIDVSENGGDESERLRAKGFVELLTPICKARCSDVGFQIATTAVQVYGGYGYTQEYPVEQHLRDVRISAIYEGANGVQAMDLLGRKLGMQKGAVFQAYMKEMGALVRSLADHATLGGAAAELGKAAQAVGETAMYLGVLARERVDEAFLWATDFLQQMGDCVFGYQLLQQATLAAGKLEELVGANPDRDTIANSPEATFYAGKVESARFFAASVLPHCAATAAAVKSGSSAPLDVVF